MKKSSVFVTWLTCFVLGLFSSAHIVYATKPSKDEPVRIVSLDGTVSEILCDLGLQSHLIGVDVTSTYPESLQKLPKVGHNRTISAEGVISLKPTLVLTTQNAGTKPEVIEQIKSAGIKVISFQQEYSVAGAKKLIQDVATTCQVGSKAKPLIKKLDTDVAQVKKATNSPKVLFIYARGTGTMMVSGRGTQVDKMIELAGGVNATPDFDNYKPLTAEALVTANPDVILLFDSGLESLGGTAGLLKVQGVAQTNAGKNSRIIEMDGHLLTGFSPRLGKALQELAQKIAQKPKA
ncbi:MULTISPECIES: heme/hemin ABC transporter substrate-binding protein [Spirosoma]|uniref:ABC transporter substrate-binding protein n=1 Tax=Spirosoma liriopis TaxID=2937440 RepID=A0ABT0HHI1_9BACT|nr:MULTISPECIES: ABC transporter substrate-binding protein [Spirosoma]MCK8491614.1 ABC transporter substrate-binding protein [Spirosoma liriopis]UHG90975.1 ABC transporter substrate-binding protein [Spirosoma oryzicola]